MPTTSAASTDRRILDSGLTGVTITNNPWHRTGLGCAMPGSTSKILKRCLYALGVGLGLLIIGGAVAVFSWGRNSKAQVQAAASDALGMQVTIGGALKVRVFPAF